MQADGEEKAQGLRPGVPPTFETSKRDEGGAVREIGGGKLWYPESHVEKVFKGGLVKAFW